MEKRGSLPKPDVEEVARGTDNREVDERPGIEPAHESRYPGDAPLEEPISSPADLQTVHEILPSVPDGQKPGNPETESLSPTDPSLTSAELENVIAQILDTNAGDEHD